MKLALFTLFVLCMTVGLWADAETAPFLECPAAGSDTSCRILIEIVGSGGAVNNQYNVFEDLTQPPYEDVEDTLIGVKNESGGIVNSIDVSSPTSAIPIFGFEGDGICTFVSCAGNVTDTTGYGGPLAFFTNIAADQRSGTVNFQGGLADGAITFFSLEDVLTKASIQPSVPEPGSLILLGTGMLALAGFARKRLKA